MLGKIQGRGKKWATDSKMVGWHHLLNEHEFEQITEDSEGQGSLACCSTQGCKVLDMAVTEQQQQQSRMDEHNMVYSHSEVLFGNKNE